MARRKTTWKCSRVTAGEKCGHENPNRFKLCRACGKERPPRQRAAHLAALDQPYEVFVQANGGVDACGVCGRPPSETRRLDRDHGHVGEGVVRGVLCHRHNRGLEFFGDDPALLRAAAEYLERHQ